MTVFKGYGEGTPYLPGENYKAGAWKAPQYTPRADAVSADALDVLHDNQLAYLIDKIQAEVKRRVKPVQQAHYGAFSNFLLGVAHAMACRYALRWLRGHNPVGKAATSGEMWTAFDGSELERRVAGDVGPIVRTKYSHRLLSNPLTWTTRGDLEKWLSKNKYGSQAAFVGPML